MPSEPERRASPADAFPARLSREIETVLQSREFESALRSYACGLMAFYREQPTAIGIIGDLGRFAIVSAFIVADAPIPARRIAESLLGPGLAGRQRVNAHVAFLRRSGALEAFPAARSKGGGLPLAPSPWIIQRVGGWLAAVAGPALVWRAGEPINLSDPAVQKGYLSQLLTVSRRGGTAFKGLATVGRLMTLTGGHIFMAELIAGDIGADGRSFRFSRTVFSSRYCVSRTHVIDLVREAGAGAGRHVAPRGYLALSDALRAELRMWAAVNFVLANVALSGRLTEYVEAS